VSRTSLANRVAALEDQLVRSVPGQTGTDLFAVERCLCICRSLRIGRRPNWNVPLLKTARGDPPGLQRRVNIRRIRRCARNANKAVRTVGGNRDGPGLRAIFGTGRIAQGQAGLIERVELFEDQQSQRLPEVERRFPDRADQIPVVERRHPHVS
jgi:hypothetical protein